MQSDFNFGGDDDDDDDDYGGGRDGGFEGALGGSVYSMPPGTNGMEKVGPVLSHVVGLFSLLCKVAGYSTAIRARGLCGKHGANVIYSVAGCGTAAEVRSLCTKHGAYGI